MGKTDLPFELVNVEFRLTTMLSLVIQNSSLLLLTAKLNELYHVKLLHLCAYSKHESLSGLTWVAKYLAT